MLLNLRLKLIQPLIPEDEAVNKEMCSPKWSFFSVLQVLKLISRYLLVSCWGKSENLEVFKQIQEKFMKSGWYSWSPPSHLLMIRSWYLDLHLPTRFLLLTHIIEGLDILRSEPQQNYLFRYLLIDGLLFLVG